MHKGCNALRRVAAKHDAVFSNDSHCEALNCSQVHKVTRLTGNTQLASFLPGQRVQGNSQGKLQTE